MSGFNANKINFLLNKLNLGVNKHMIVRNLRGRAPEFAKTLAQRLAALNVKDPDLAAMSDISLPSTKTKSFKEIFRERTKFLKENRKRPEIFELSRSNKLLIDLDEVKKDYQITGSKLALEKIARHYGIFEDLFRGEAFFVPRVALEVSYDYDKETVTPVHRGNIIEASEAKTVPMVHFDSSPDDLWTLILTNPDGHLQDNESEYLHWFIGNIRGNKLETGQELFEYLLPFPVKGAGYQRMIFLLYKQEKLLDYSGLAKKAHKYNLKSRTFKNYDFYKSFQDDLTPAGLAFYQTVWDDSVTDIFHNLLDMPAPVYEYDYPPEVFDKQVKYPERSFNKYLDRYRDEKEMRKEIVLKRLKTLDPFVEEPPMHKYPNIFRLPRGTPSWRKPEIWKERNRIGRYRDLRPYTSYPEPEFDMNNYLNKTIEAEDE